MELVAHEHFSDLRYHSSQNVLDLKDTDVKYDFHNMFVSPGMSPYKNQNPGVAMFEVSDLGLPFGLKMEFLDLNPTLGMSSIPAYSDLTFRSFDLT